VMRPETVVRWHRRGFRLYWAWKSRRGSGRPAIGRGLRDLIRQMSRANPLWGAPRIHGELLKLGLTVAQATVSKYMVRPRRPPSQTGRTFLKNHASDLIALDFFTVPTATFRSPLLARDADAQPAPAGAFQCHGASDRRLDGATTDRGDYYNAPRTHLSLAKDAPESRRVQPPSQGRVVEVPRVGGLHHEYVRRVA
jgi:hypothetical protein